MNRIDRLTLLHAYVKVCIFLTCLIKDKRYFNLELCRSMQIECLEIAKLACVVAVVWLELIAYSTRVAVEN